MKTNGWVKLHRRTLNSWVFKDADRLWIWIYLLLHATHKPFPFKAQGKEFVLEDGQYLTSCRRISFESKVSKTKVNKILREMRDKKMIKITDLLQDSHYQLISIVNWEKYQNKAGQLSGQPLTELGTKFGTAKSSPPLYPPIIGKKQEVKTRENLKPWEKYKDEELAKRKTIEQERQKLKKYIPV